MLSPILLQYWQSLVRWRFVIIGIVAVCLAVGVVVTLLMPSTYTARTQIEISREQKNVTNVEGLDSQTEGRDLEFYATQHALLKAESLAQRVARKLDLANSKAFFAAHGAELAILDATSDKRAPAQERQREREATAMLLANVEIGPIRTSRPATTR